MFFKTATEYDSALVEGMNNSITGGLIWARPMLGTALSLYVIGHGFLMMYACHPSVWHEGLLTR
jgi:hypothetical protein